MQEHIRNRLNRIEKVRADEMKSATGYQSRLRKAAEKKLNQPYDPVYNDKVLGHGRPIT